MPGRTLLQPARSRRATSPPRDLRGDGRDRRLRIGAQPRPTGRSSRAAGPSRSATGPSCSGSRRTRPSCATSPSASARSRGRHRARPRPARRGTLRGDQPRARPRRGGTPARMTSSRRPDASSRASSPASRTSDVDEGGQRWAWQPRQDGPADAGRHGPRRGGARGPDGRGQRRRRRRQGRRHRQAGAGLGDHRPGSSTPTTSRCSRTSSSPPSATRSERGQGGGSKHGGVTGGLRIPGARR